MTCSFSFQKNIIIERGLDTAENEASGAIFGNIIKVRVEYRVGV